MSESEYSKRYFELKGKSAEQAVVELANKSFLKEWCYPNPKGPDGKEICDLLVFFNGNLLVIQIKDIKFTGNEERYIRKAIDHPIKQVKGALNKLQNLKTGLTLTNETGFSHEFNISEVNKIYRVVLSVGEGEIFFNLVDDGKGHIVHTFDRSIQTVLSELDTISDFCQYLEKKEQLYFSESLPDINLSMEVDVMANYLFNGKSFDHLLGHDSVYIQKGYWANISKRKEFIAKREANKISYFWDHLIDVSNTCEGHEYRDIARELSASNRFERRYLSELFFSAHRKAEENKIFDFRRVGEFQGKVYVFLFSPQEVDRTQRANHLNNICIVAKDKYRNLSNVIGIATEIGSKIPHTYDFFYMDFPEWIEENQKLALDIQKKHNILINPKLTRFTSEEYPHLDKNTHDGSVQRKKIGRNDPCPCGSGKKYKKCCLKHKFE